MVSKYKKRKVKKRWGGRKLGCARNGNINLYAKPGRRNRVRQLALSLKNIVLGNLKERAWCGLQRCAVVKWPRVKEAYKCSAMGTDKPFDRR